ncbi:MAG: cytochrome P450 [Alphaproteobacteria bacterium]
MTAQPIEQTSSIPENGIHVADPDLWAAEKVLPLFEKLRNEDPVHLCKDSPYGPYWSITKYKDIVEVDTTHNIFSSAADLGGIVIDDNLTNDADSTEEAFESFISMDQPRHSSFRKAVQPIAASPSIKAMEDLIRERTCMVLDNLPINEEFDWVEEVSIKLTTMMLATLFDFPFEDRAKLTRWSDVFVAEPGQGIVESQEQRLGEIMECLEYFTKLWNERVNEPPKFDLISMMAHDPDTKNMTPMQYVGNLALLIVGGNDTTRNTMSATINMMNLFPDQFDMVRKDHSLIDNMVAEVIRWQTPLSHMRRTALQDYELGGKLIKKGDKVVMWYYSGNRDADEFETADKIDIMRPNVRKHVSFGYGIHRCMGLRLAELQLRVLWQEILARWDNIELTAHPERVRSNFVNGYAKMTVKIKG